MNVAGIIAEYNPLHSGHVYHIEETRRLTGCDYLVVVMSGDFVQRGEPALLDKYTRTRLALQAGADLVLELPAVYAIGSAEFFAGGAVSILDGLGCVNTISFGSECSSMALMRKLAAILLEEPLPFREKLREQLKKGKNYPAARETAMLSYLKETDLQETDLETVHTILSSPNDLLGLEYTKALLRKGSAIAPLCISRMGSYHDEMFPDTLLHFASATAVRKVFCESPDRLHSAELSTQVPEYTLAVLREAKETGSWLVPDDLSQMLGYRLLSLRNGDLTTFADVSTELAQRILANLTAYSSFSTFADLCSSRQYTRTRILRSLLHILSGLTSETMQSLKDAGFPSYARVLGFRKSASPLLTEIGKKKKLPFLTKMADAPALLNDLPLLPKTLDHEVFLSDLYSSLQREKQQRTCSSAISMKNEYNHGLIIIP